MNKKEVERFRWRCAAEIAAASIVGGKQILKPDDFANYVLAASMLIAELERTAPQKETAPSDINPPTICTHFQRITWAGTDTRVTCRDCGATL